MSLNRRLSRPEMVSSRAVIATTCLLLGCVRPGTLPESASPDATIERTRSLLAALSDDSMQGRRVATSGEHRAARFIAARFREAGLEAAGDSGYFQRLPMAMITTRSTSPNGQERIRTGPSLVTFADLDTIPEELRLTSVNVLGVLRGSDPRLRDEVVVVGAHFDHLGIRPAVDGDSIANGADDDASGTVAVMEAARIIAAGSRPKRTMIFAAFTGEESGGFGVTWYTRNPVVPLDRHVADLQVEMIGQSSSAVGGPGKAGLTGFERSTMGAVLAAAGIPVMADPLPTENLFFRSDNIAFARLGIVAHTMSSFGVNNEYHTVNDELELVDLPHMTEMVKLVARAARTLADGPRLQWNPGGKP